MPSWTDDSGRCHFDVGGVPCHRSETGCRVHPKLHVPLLILARRLQTCLDEFDAHGDAVNLRDEVKDAIRFLDRLRNRRRNPHD